MPSPCGLSTAWTTPTAGSTGRRPPPWDGRWHVLVVPRPEGRTARDRLASALAFLGYAEIGAATWVAPRPHPDVAAVLEGEGARAEMFTAAYDGVGPDLAGRAWDLSSVAAAYERFEGDARRLLARPGDPSDPDRTAFTTRSRLVHEWRNFLFLDPGLPDEVLPSGWPGHRAAQLFDQAAGELLPAASRFVDRCLGSAEEADE